MTETKFKITNITCEACVKLSTVALKKLPGFESVNIDEKSGLVSLKSTNEVTWDGIVAALKAVGKNVERI
jgi:copper chaperone CopZ